MRGVQIPNNARLHPIALIENDEAIQASLMEVINALARNTIDFHRAQLILRALSIAVRNARRARFGVSDNEMVREVPNYPVEPKPVRTDSEPASTKAVTELTGTIAPSAATLPAQEKGSIDPAHRKPQARAGLPEGAKAAVGAAAKR